MTLRKEKKLLGNVLLGAGLYLLDSVRDRLAENAKDFSERAREGYGDLRDRATDMYSTASDRLGRANDALMGEDRRFMNNAGAVLLGAGIGIGIGLLLAPASGEKTRSNIAEKLRDRFAEKVKPTGTYGS